MISSRWWLVVLVATSLAAFTWLSLSSPPPGVYPVALGIVAVYAALFLALRRRAVEGNRAAVVLTAATILYVATLTAVSPEFATLQFFAFPLIWVLAGGVRQALVASFVLAASVGLGFWIAFGASTDNLATVLLTPVLSFTFSTVMGLWISRIAALGEEKTRLLDELTALQEQLALTNRDAGITAERARMSREVHDTVAQSLTGLVMLAQQARREFAAGRLDEDALSCIESSARDALAETRAIVASSAPLELVNQGLDDAFTQLVGRFEQGTSIRASLEMSLDAPLDRDAEVVLLRCAQEALANVRKHAGASQVVVALSVDAAEARLTVTDDGRGFDPLEASGFGLSGLRDRLALAGGELHVDGTTGATRLTAVLPREVGA